MRLKNLTIDLRVEAQQISRFLRETVHSRGFKRVVIACSGGIDSSTALYLAARALGSENVIPLLLPYGDLNRVGLRNAEKALNNLGIGEGQRVVIDIKGLVDDFTRHLALKRRIRIGNIAARCRMIIVFDQAAKHQALVLGTENRSEQLLGYYTRFGDEASDIEPIRHLYKTQVYKLAEFLGVPTEIRDQAPTAGLWVGQTDEGEFGFAYSEADPILFALYDQGKTVGEVMALGFSKDLVLRVKNWVERYSFKHELPYIYSPNSHLS